MQNETRSLFETLTIIIVCLCMAIFTGCCVYGLYVGFRMSLGL